MKTKLLKQEGGNIEILSNEDYIRLIQTGDIIFIDKSNIDKFIELLKFLSLNRFHSLSLHSIRAYASL